MKRAIVLFPDFYKMNMIQEIRGNYDPLVHRISPLCFRLRVIYQRMRCSGTVTQA